MFFSIRQHLWYCFAAKFPLTKVWGNSRRRENKLKVDRPEKGSRRSICFFSFESGVLLADCRRPKFICSYFWANKLLFFRLGSRARTRAIAFQVWVWWPTLRPAIVCIRLVFLRLFPWYCSAHSSMNLICNVKSAWVTFIWQA